MQKNFKFSKSSFQFVKINILADVHRKAAYLVMSKVASTSLIESFFKSESSKDGIFAAKKRFGEESRLPEEELRKILDIHRIRGFLLNPKSAFFITEPSVLDNLRVIYTRGDSMIMNGKGQDNLVWSSAITSADLDGCFIFTFVRNPFTKLVSFFENKFIYQNGFYCLKKALGERFKKVRSFEDLVHEILSLPDCDLESHTFPQSFIIRNASKHGIKIDFIGRFERIREDFESVRQKTGLLSLNHKNENTGEKDWRDYYTPETAKLIYERYREDFEMLGYEEEYPKLLAHLKQKNMLFIKNLGRKGSLASWAKSKIGALWR